MKEPNPFLPDQILFASSPYLFPHHISLTLCVKRNQDCKSPLLTEHWTAGKFKLFMLGPVWFHTHNIQAFILFLAFSSSFSFFKGFILFFLYLPPFFFYLKKSLKLVKERWNRENFFEFDPLQCYLLHTLWAKIRKTCNLGKSLMYTYLKHCTMYPIFRPICAVLFFDGLQK